VPGPNIDAMAVSPREGLPFDTRRPFNRADARSGGVTLRELLSPKFHKVFYDTYVDSRVPLTTRLRATAALNISPAGSYASHYTAAELWGGVVPAVAEVHVTVLGKVGRLRRQGVTAHSGLDLPAPTSHQGIPLSGSIQTVLDLAGAGLDLVSLVVLADSLVTARRFQPIDLVDAAHSWGGHGAKRARLAGRFVRGGVDSPQETRLRMLLVLAGLPEPVINEILRWPDGSWRMRLDLSYPELRLIIEYDGRQHAENTAQWNRDLRRREELESLGWRIVVITARDLNSEPGATLERVRAAMVERGATGLRRHFKTEWQRYFAA
jgi:hypothetical protein